jgi:hypothetical protein
LQDDGFLLPLLRKIMKDYETDKTHVTAIRPYAFGWDNGAGD